MMMRVPCILVLLLSTATRVSAQDPAEPIAPATVAEVAAGNEVLTPSVAEPAPEIATAVEAAPPAPAPRAPAATAPPVEAAPAITFSVEPGRGFTLRAGDAFSVNLAARVQIRNTVHIDRDGADLDLDPQVGNELQIRTLRLWLRGHVLDPNVRYGIQLAFGGNDFEAGNASPIFDAYLELTHIRDLSVRVGQFFVQFDRARTIREFALQSVDRAEVIRELTLDRDVGVDVFSEDLFGLGGRLAYHLGVYGGDGRNRFGTTAPGFLFSGRVAVRPMGSFDDDREGDTVRTADPRLGLGIAFAFNHQTDRPRSTTGTAYSGVTFDQLHFAADLTFKWQGFYLLSEVVWRQATSPFRDHLLMDGTNERVYARDAVGYLVQASQMMGPIFEVWARWEELSVYCANDPSVTGCAADPRLLDQVNATGAGIGGRGIAGGVNAYLNGHALKVQLDWAMWFSGDRLDRGTHVVRLQLDASF